MAHAKCSHCFKMTYLILSRLMRKHNVNVCGVCVSFNILYDHDES
jgi:hypothetical protein